MGESAAEVASSYSAELEELTFNSKPIINSLTMIAEELLPWSGVIVEVIESKIQSAPADQRLPIIYLMDSIVKNIGGAYKERFARSAPELLGGTYDVATPKVMTSLKNLAKTWDGVFPAVVLERVNARLVGGGTATGGNAPPMPAAAPPPLSSQGAVGDDSRKRPRGGAVAAGGATKPRTDPARSELQGVVQRVHAHLGAGLAADVQLMELIARSVAMYRQLLSSQPHAADREQLSAQLWEMQRIQVPARPRPPPPHGRLPDSPRSCAL